MEFAFLSYHLIAMENEKTYFLTLVNYGYKRDEENTIVLKWRMRPYDDDFKALQREVDGIFGHGYLFAPESDQYKVLSDRKIDVWINDEGKLGGFDPSLPVYDLDGSLVDVVFGNICFLHGDDMTGESSGLTMDDCEVIVDMIQRLFIKGFLPWVSGVPFKVSD